MPYNVPSRQPGRVLLHGGAPKHVSDRLEQQEPCHQVWMLLRWRERLGPPLWDLPFPGHCGLQKTLPPWPRIYDQWSRYFLSFWLMTGEAGNSLTIQKGICLFVSWQTVENMESSVWAWAGSQTLYYGILDVRGQVAKAVVYLGSFLCITRSPQLFKQKFVVSQLLVTQTVNFLDEPWGRWPLNS